jgi:hypothetical protein
MKTSKIRSKAVGVSLVARRLVEQGLLQPTVIPIASRTSEPFSPKTKAQPDVRVSRNVADIPRTKQDAFNLLSRMIAHVENSGKPGCLRFAAPQDTYQFLQKCIKAVGVKWVRKQKTSRAALQTFRKLRRRVRRVAHKNDVLVFQKIAVPLMRAALPNLYGQGFLRRCVRVHPYRACDEFLGRHPVKVFRQRNLFDVVDAHCNIPILAGITKRALKQFVEW